VFLQAGANPTGPSGACFAHARSGTLALVTSPDTVAVLDPASLLRELGMPQKNEER
jgi:hypothetical protein